MKTLLAVDLGGTKAELALFDLNNKSLTPLHHRVIRCAGQAGIEAIIEIFLQDAPVRPDVACLGVAGVIDNGGARITNLPWEIAGEALEREFSLAAVTLINDMTALCSALSTLGGGDLLTLQEGRPENGGTRAVIAPGTGLGEGYLIETADIFLPRGSEGSHADFAPGTDEQLELLRWVGRKTRPVSFESVCSGLGIPVLYDFLKEQRVAVETAAIAEKLRGAKDRTPAILEGAVAADPCPLCRKTMELFLSILGGEAGNLALKTYAAGGVFIGGGILPRLAGKMPLTGVIDAFRRKSKMEDLMVRMPVHVILRRDAVLLGTAVYGRRFFLSGR